MSLSDDIRAKYLGEGRSRRGLADEIDVPEAVIRRFEAGRGVHPKHALPIAQYLGVEVTDLPQFAAENEPGAGPRTVEPWRAEGTLADDAPTPTEVR